ncbi:MAG: DUF1573 domain-containing protein [Planctomycetota bacterium]|nr:DUF1573 domain-containing protein [Planctomycetota bacterium]
MLRLAPVLLSCALLFAGCGSGDDQVTVTPGRHDFGRVQQGDKPSKVFTVTNGTSRVVSVMPQPNCSCFAVERGRSLRPLDPGDSMQVTVLFDSTAKPPGPVQGKWVTFNLDHPTQRKVIVPLEGEIYRAYDILPAKVSYGRIDGRPTNHEPRVITLTPQPGYALKVERVVPTPALFETAIRAGQGGATEVLLTLPRDLPARPLGAFRAVVRLEIELTAADGTTFKQRPVLPIEGTWARKADGTPVR